MFSHWTYVLVGSNDTGKTTFQRYLVRHLCGVRYDRLPLNIVSQITHHRAPRQMRTLFTSNRSYQEKKDKYGSVENYFKKFFRDADVCFLSSHAGGSARQQIAEMISQLRRRCYNVGGVFWSNSDSGDSQRAAGLPWNEVFWINNPILQNKGAIDRQLDLIALQFADMILSRAHFQ